MRAECDNSSLPIRYQHLLLCDASKATQVLAHMQACVQREDSIGISAVTDLALRHGEIGRKAPTGLTAQIESERALFITLIKIPLKEYSFEAIFCS